jgi:hypothetical protein
MRAGGPAPGTGQKPDRTGRRVEDGSHRRDCRRQAGDVSAIFTAQRQTFCSPPGNADEGLWHLADLDLVRAARRDSRFCAGAEGDGAQGRRPDRHRRLEPPAALLGVLRGAIAQSHSGSRLCRFGGRGDGLCSQPCRRTLCCGSGPGAGRQDPVDGRRNSRTDRHHL